MNIIPSPRHVIRISAAVAVFACLLPEISFSQTVEITDSARKQEILNRIKEQYFSTQENNIHQVKCTIGNSLLEQADRIARESDTASGLHSPLFSLSVNDEGHASISKPRMTSGRDTPETERLKRVVDKMEKSLERMLEVVYGFSSGEVFRHLSSPERCRLMGNSGGYTILMERSRDTTRIEVTKGYLITLVRITSKKEYEGMDFGYHSTDRGALINKLVLDRKKIYKFDIEYREAEGVPVLSRVTLQGEAADDIFSAAGTPADDSGLMFVFDNYKLKFNE